MEQKFRDIPDFYKVKTNKLTDYLGSPPLWAKRAAWHQIADRPMKKTRRLASDLISLAMDTTQNTVTRIHALWSLERSEEHTSELQSLMRLSYAVFCLNKKKPLNSKAQHHTSDKTSRNKQEL